MPKGLKQKTLDGFLGLDERTGLATLPEQLRPVESQARFGLVRTMACDAVLNETRSNPLLKELCRVLLLRPGKLVRKSKRVRKGQGAGPEDAKLGCYSLGGWELGTFGGQSHEHGRSIRKGEVGFPWETLKHTTSLGGIAKAFHLFLACWGALDPLEPPDPAWSILPGVY